MTNYLLSVDPAIKNTGFTLWEFKKPNYEELFNGQFAPKWKPIWVSSYNFKNIDIHSGMQIFINNMISNIDIITYADLDLIIERGFPNMKGSETLDHLRGFIAGQFNKLLTKDMLISPKEWQKWYLKNLSWNLEQYQICDVWEKKWKWNKDFSLLLAKELISNNNWNITISNHDEADSLLIGWYYLNKENK